MDAVASSMAFAAYPLLRVGVSDDEFRSGLRADLAKQPEALLIARVAPLVSERIRRGPRPSLYTSDDSARDILAHGFDAVREDLENLTHAVDGVGESIRDMASLLSGQLHYLADLSNQQIAKLDEINQALREPKQVAASELRARGAEAYSYGHIEASRADFRAAVRENPYDYESLLYLGHVALRMGEPREAVECYELAADYSQPRGMKLVAALARLGAARSLQELDDAEAAVISSREASRHLGPARWDGAFEAARSHVLADDAEGAIEPLAQALAAGPFIVSSLCLAEAIPLPLPAAQRLAIQEARRLGEEVADVAGLDRPPVSDTILDQVAFNRSLADHALAAIARRQEADEERVAAEIGAQSERREAFEYERRRSGRRARRAATAQEWLAWPAGLFGVLVGAFLLNRLFGVTFTSPISGTGVLGVLVVMVAAPWLSIRALNSTLSVAHPEALAEVQVTGDPSIDAARQRLEELAARPLAGAELRRAERSFKQLGE